MRFKNQSSNNPNEICNLFSVYFKSVYEPSSLSNDFCSNAECAECCNVVDNIQFSVQQVLRHLETLDISKGPGPDALPAIFLRNTASNICVPLQIIFNRSLSQGIFPDTWKRANITPVLKSGPSDDVENYRPISILSTLSKIFEKLVHNVLYPLLHNIIAPQQHGFVKKRSTVTNLVAYSEYIFNDMDAGIQLDSVYTDFQKAFDKVDHELLLRKIAFNGIRGNLLRWFSSYVSNRTQRVVINGYQSSSIAVTSGVPQGSILGPLLFILFINDIGKCFQNSKFLLYADDLKIFRQIKNPSDCLALQDDLNRLSEYCMCNKLKLSVPKCCYLNVTKNKHIFSYQYSLNDVTLNRVTMVRDLGIIFDDKLHLDVHINTIINKAWRMYGFVMRSATEFVRPQTYLYLYKTLIRSQLEYAVAVWNPLYMKYSNCLEMVQKKFLRSMTYRCFHSSASYADLLRKYNLLSLTGRRMFLETVLLYDFCRNTYDCSDICNRICYLVPRRVHLRAARKQPLFAVRACRTNAGVRAPLRRLVENYNNHFLDIDLFCATRGKFRNSIRNAIKESDRN